MYSQLRYPHTLGSDDSELRFVWAPMCWLESPCNTYCIEILEILGVVLRKHLVILINVFLKAQCCATWVEDIFSS